MAKSQKELNGLESFFESTGEIIPLDSRKNYFIYHCTNFIDSIDKKKSEFTISNNFEITWINHYEFLYEKVKNQDIFRDINIIKSNNNIYCSEQFIENMVKSSLRGFILTYLSTPNGKYRGTIISNC